MTSFLHDVTPVRTTIAIAMAAAVGPLDEVIKEYLVFRGFTNTLKYFDLERKDDKDKGFKVSCNNLQKDGISHSDLSEP